MVSHILLSQKLSVLNIPAKLTIWMEAYLLHRRQRVVLDGVTSSYANVLSGIPQGSVMGPLLFLVFINDLAEPVSSRVNRYADNYVGCETDYNSLQDDLNSALSWCSRWNMTLAISKCKLIRFRIKKNSLS